ncbi:uncharacterized protein LOC141664640 [Apium graveolens]|uniref:uncharacterized protein LOC141664640 n=1 Tax=Apium graveolens TaxID=4045 RepID=UPI003D7B1C5F
MKQVQEINMKEEDSMDKLEAEEEKDCYSRLKYERNETSFLHESSESKNEESVLLMFNEQEVSTKNIWYIDSGCSHHMIGHKSILINLDESVQREVKTDDDKRHLIQGCGDVPIQTKRDQNFVRDVYYIPGLKHNLLSVGQLLNKGHNVIFNGELCDIRDKNNSLIARIKMTPNKIFPLKLNETSLNCFSSIVEDKSWLWHLRYNHLSFSTLSKIFQEHMVRGIPYINKQDQICEGHVFGKHKRDSFPSGMAKRAS